MVGNEQATLQREEAKNSGTSARLITVSEPAGAASEAYRSLRTSLLYTQVDRPTKVLLVTSAGSEEGKTTVCANLGVVLAQAGKNTLIIDCDLRRPAVHKVFGLRNIAGIVDILADERSLSESWQEPLPDLSLKVVTAGPLPPNPAELLSSRRLSQFLAEVRSEFDYVLIDSPPARLVSDPIILATQGDGVLLTLDAQTTRKVDVRRTVRSLTTVGANVLGTVMTNVKGTKQAYY
jgi:receptor protein-tyrosine kinase